jgi:lipopolysaccharide heptosyltransferase II
MNKIKFLKLFDKVVGKPFVWLLSIRWEDKKEIPEKFKKVLFIRPGGIGDAVLLLPAIHLLRENFPDSYIDVLCEKRNADIFRFSRDINRIYLYDKGFDLLKYIWNRYDVVIDTEQWHRLSAVAAYLTRASVRIGFFTNERGKLFTHQIPYSHDDYEVYSFLHLIEPITKNSLSFDVNKSFINTDLVSLSYSSFFEETKNNGECIAIFPGASVNERRWGGERFGEVAKILHAKGYKIIILGSHADTEDAAKIKEYADNSLDLTGKTSLKEVAAILKKCKLLITADSGLMHIAYGVGTPTVSLFGSGIEKKWAPGGKKFIVINKHLSCSPCTKFGYTPRCKRNVECLSSISVAEVIKAVEMILNQD